jgi:hypothetical protein
VTEGRGVSWALENLLSANVALFTEAEKNIKEIIIQHDRTLNHLANH